MKKHSTGALTTRQKEAQDDLYHRVSSSTEYDYLIVGSGNAALTCGALLAHAGNRICMLEMHDTPGGYAHTFHVGDYSFCAQVHYIWSCHPGGRIYETMRHLDLLDSVKFAPFDPDGYDHMIMPDGKRVKVPCGWDALAQNITEAYPETLGLNQFLDVIKSIREEMQRLPRKEITGWDIVFRRFFFPTLNRYRYATLQDVFDECGLSMEAQTVLSAQAGDFLLPPSKLSVFFYAGLLAGYNTGAYAPYPSFASYTEALVRVIRENGGDVYFEEAVDEYVIEDGKVVAVRTGTGKVFKAKQFICGSDPKLAAEQIGLERFPKRYRAKLSYNYSSSGIMIYLGMKPGFDPGKYGLGNHNTWHCLDWDMNKMWQAGEALELEKAWFFLSTPTLHGAHREEQLHTLEIGTYAPYDVFKEAMASKDYLKLKSSLADRLLKLVSQHHIPDLKEQIAIKLVGSPLTNEDFCGAPMGNAYGAEMTPENAAPRLGAKTPFNNLFFCNATSGSPGVYGTTSTGMDLYTALTGDDFFHRMSVVRDDEIISHLRHDLVSGLT